MPRASSPARLATLSAGVLLGTVALAAGWSGPAPLPVTPVTSPRPVTSVTPTFDPLGTQLPFAVPASPDAAHLEWERARRRQIGADGSLPPVKALAFHLESVRLAERFGDQRLAYSLFNLAYNYMDQRRMDDARAALLRARAILEKHPSAPFAAAVEDELANVYGALGEADEAEKHNRVALAHSEESGEQGTYGAASALFRLARKRCDEGAVEEARVLLARVVELLEALEAREPVPVSHMAGEVAELAIQLHEDAMAEKLWRRQLALHERLEGPGSVAVARALTSLASFFELAGRHAEAEPLVTRALAVFQSKRGAGSYEVATCHETMGQLALGQGNGEGAIRHASAALAIYEKMPVETIGVGPLVSMHLLRGQGHEEMQIYPEALAEFRKALELQEKSGQVEPKDTAYIMAEVARLEMDCGDRKRGRALIDRLIAWIRSGALGPRDTFTAVEQVAPLLEMIDSLDEARQVWEMGLKSLALDPAAPPTYRMSFDFGIARVLLMKHDPAGAEPFVSEALALWDRSPGDFPPKEAHRMGDLAELYMENRRPEKAVAIVERKHRVLKEQLGAKDPGTVVCRLELAEARLAAGDAPGAIADFEACLEGGRPSPALDAEKRRWLREGYAEALDRTGRPEEAARIDRELK